VKAKYRATRRFSLLLLSIGAMAVVAQKNPPPAIKGEPDAPSLIQRATGTWDVRQRMWPGPGTEAIDLPRAIAHRRLIGDTILEEQMELPPETKELVLNLSIERNGRRVSRV